MPTNRDFSPSVERSGRLMSRSHHLSGGERPSEASRGELDTSGVVVLRKDPTHKILRPEDQVIRWSDLTPFQQGTVKAALEEFHDSIARSGPMFAARAAFRHLSAPTLARLLEDCERYVSYQPPRNRESTGGSAISGRDYWRWRQSGLFVGHPNDAPLHLSLQEDGLIGHREQGE